METMASIIGVIYFFIFIGCAVALVYFIAKRFEDKSKEKFEKRNY